jgi:exonuclease SbcD
VALRIAHLADLHLGYAQFSLRTPDGQNLREADVQRAALAAAELICAEEKPDLAVVAGDLGHMTRISNSALDGALAFCERFRDAGIPLIVIGGNHDHAEGEASRSMLELLRHAGATIVLDQQTIEVAGACLHLIPFRVLSRAACGRAEVSAFEFSAELPNILVAHAATQAPGIAPEEVVIPREWLNDKRFSLCLLGHIHQHRQLNPRAFYAGAVERLGYGERNETPGFWIHTVHPEGGVESQSISIASLGVPLTPRPMQQHHLDGSGKTLEELDRAARALLDDKIPGALIRLVVCGVTAAFSRSRLRQEWADAFREAGAAHLDVVTEMRSVAEALRETEGVTVQTTDLRQGALAFINEQDFQADAERELTLLLAGEVIDEAREKLAALEA